MVVGIEGLSWKHFICLFTHHQVFGYRTNKQSWAPSEMAPCSLCSALLSPSKEVSEHSKRENKLLKEINYWSSKISLKHNSCCTQRKVSQMLFRISRGLVISHAFRQWHHKQTAIANQNSDWHCQTGSILPLWLLWWWCHIYRTWSYTKNWTWIPEVIACLSY